MRDFKRNYRLSKGLERLPAVRSERLYFAQQSEPKSG
jgi:hypothetical protein